MDKRFVKPVHCSDEFFGATPDTIVVTIVPTLTGKIREWAMYVRQTGAFTLQIFLSTPSWYERNWEDEDMNEGTVLSTLGNLFAPLESVLLVVSSNVFWWEANLPDTSIRLTTESISIDEL